MRRKKVSTLTPVILGEKVYDPVTGETVETRVPFKLDKKDLDFMMVEVHGFKFIDLGRALVCPTCARISAIGSRVDLDKKIDWFLRFGCQHYDDVK